MLNPAHDKRNHTGISFLIRLAKIHVWQQNLLASLWGIRYSLCWWRYKGLVPMKGNLARSSKIMYAFALYPGNLLLGIFPKDTPARASLMVHWLRICMPMQGTWVWALVWEDPTCCRATRPVSHNYWACASGACTPQQERPRQWEARAPRWRGAPARRN